MGDVLSFPDRIEPMDDITVCTVTVTGKGDVSLWLHGYLETPEQFNWLIAKLTAAGASIIDRKLEVMG